MIGLGGKTEDPSLELDGPTQAELAKASCTGFLCASRSEQLRASSALHGPVLGAADSGEQERGAHLSRDALGGLRHPSLVCPPRTHQQVSVHTSMMQSPCCRGHPALMGQ